MAETSSLPSDAHSFWLSIVERIGRARWLIAAVAVVLSVFYATEILTLFQAGVTFAAVGIMIGVVPSAASSTHSVTIGEAHASTAPKFDIDSLAEALPDPCLVLDRAGIVRHANSNAVAAFSIEPGEPMAFRLRVPDLNAAFDRVAAGGPPERIEFSEHGPTERWFAAYLARLDSPPPQDLIVLTLEDLSVHRRVDRIRVDFVANASHELRTPLASLAGFIETLQGSARDDPAARERFLPIMHDQATRMSRLIDDLLSLSRIELKVHVPPSDAVDLVSVLHHLSAALEPMAHDLGVKLDTVLPPGPVIVNGDRDELVQVFENLIENAIKYGQSGERVVVTIKSADENSGPTVAVRDFGPGIAEEHLPRLTERFYRVNVEASRRHHGTGLGLAIAKHIIARHGARLNIESQPGDGALFSVIFPREDTEEKVEEVKNT